MGMEPTHPVPPIVRIDDGLCLLFLSVWRIQRSNLFKSRKTRSPKSHSANKVKTYCSPSVISKKLKDVDDVLMKSQALL